MTALAERKAVVLAKIEEQRQTTDALRSEIELLKKLADVENYLPYKEKRHYQGYCARETGSFPLARLILQDAANQEEAETGSVKPFQQQKLLWLEQWILTEAISEDTKLRAWTYHRYRTNSSIVISLKDGDLDRKQVFRFIMFSKSSDHARATGPWLSTVVRVRYSTQFEHNLEEIHRFLKCVSGEKHVLSEAIQQLKKKIIQLWSVVFGLS